MKIFILFILINFINCSLVCAENKIYEAEYKLVDYVANAYLGEPGKEDIVAISAYKIIESIKVDKSDKISVITKAFDSSIRRRIEDPSLDVPPDPYSNKSYIIIYITEEKQHYGVTFNDTENIFSMVKLVSLFDGIYIPSSLVTESSNKEVLLFLKNLKK